MHDSDTGLWVGMERRPTPSRFHRTRRVGKALLGVLCASLFGGCTPSVAPRLADVQGHLPDLAFQLTSDTGAQVTAADYRGKVVLLYFGFTRCADECPATMARLTASVQQAGTGAQDVRILLATVDPAHDTPALLHQYVKTFVDGHPVGLAGDAAATLALVKRYRAAYRPPVQTAHATMAGMVATDTTAPAASGTAPAMDADTLPMHGAAVYVFDRSGHARRLITPADPVDAVASDLRALLAEPA